MKYISPAYPLHQSISELLYHQISSPNPYQQQQTIQQQQQHNQDKIIQLNPFSFQVVPDQLLHPSIFKLADNNVYKAASCNNSSDSSPPPPPPPPNKDDDHEKGVNDDQNNKKDKMIIRRDVERQRRQDMSRLYSSIRSLLPLEYIKGKRSTSDLMNEATNYIKHLHKKIQEMKNKRDGLKKRRSLLNHSSNPTNINRSAGNISLQPDFVTVRPCFSGLEVVLSSSFMTDNGMLLLSRVLQLLLEEGLNVVSCVSTRVNERSLHTIQAEVSNVRGINTSDLQQKLMDLVQYSSRIPVDPGTTSSSTMI